MTSSTTGRGSPASAPPVVGVSFWSSSSIGCDHSHSGSERQTFRQRQQLQLVAVQLFAAGAKDPLDQQINLLTKEPHFSCNAGVHSGGLVRLRAASPLQTPDGKGKKAECYQFILTTIFRRPAHTTAVVCSPAQIHPVGQHGQSLPASDSNFGGLRLQVHGPGKKVFPPPGGLVSTHKPVPSQHRILIRVRRRLLKTNKRPLRRGSSPNRSVTNPCRPLKPLRRSHASTATNTFKPAGKTQHDWASPHERNKSAAPRPSLFAGKDRQSPCAPAPLRQGHDQRRRTGQVGSFGLFPPRLAATAPSPADGEGDDPCRRRFSQPVRKGLIREAVAVGQTSWRFQPLLFTTRPAGFAADFWSEDPHPTTDIGLYDLSNRLSTYLSPSNHIRYDTYRIFQDRRCSMA